MSIAAGNLASTEPGTWGSVAGEGLRLAVGVATRGRPGILMEMLADLANQTRPASEILVSYAEPADIADAPERFPLVRFIQSALGLTNQRNAILEGMRSEEVMVFLDDDFFLHPQYLGMVERVFRTHPEVSVATGEVLLDGINGPGLTVEEAKSVLRRDGLAGESDRLHRAFNAYGCNMCLRTEMIHADGLRFDQNLPLYGWYEDVEFSRQMAAYGDVVKIEGAYGAHMGAKSGRQSGLRLGYSQVANPVYLARKGSVSWAYAIASMLSRTSKNLVKCLSPEPYVDRKGRLRGNLRAWRELVSGSLSPVRVLSM